MNHRRSFCIFNASLLTFVFFMLIGPVNAEDSDHSKLVNVFTGTDAHGHTFPGAMVPHGMVQLSPDTRTETWDGCAGYHYSDKSILGFSHIHYSGVGSGGGADILLMPAIGPMRLSPGDASDPRPGYRSAFSHQNESASPGYYRVKLDNGIEAELTATPRTGLHKYTFPESVKGNIFLDLAHGINDVNDSLYVEKRSATQIAGFRHSSGGLDGNRIIWFVAEFSQPVESCTFYRNGVAVPDAIRAGGKNIQAYLGFNTLKSPEILVKVGISRVGFEGAEKNLKGELPDWDFDSIREKARQQWKKELARISVEGGTETQRRTFYTAMYHCFVHPNINMDVDRKFRSTDKKVYTAEGFDNYTTFSLWDTFRALHPLYTIIEPQRTTQFIRSFIEKYHHFGNLPIMEFGGNEGFAMIGYHSLPVIADAWAKGIRDYDVKAAYEGMKKLSEGFRDGKTVYNKTGFIPYNSESQSVARTLEYAYDDWCVSVLAKSFNTEDFHRYSQKGQFYRNLFNRESGFMHPRESDFQWLSPFDPAAETGHYTEANAFQYTTFVPQDINGLIRLMGGDEKVDRWLDACFEYKTDPVQAKLADMTGMIGQYAHGNEPSHNMAYLYNFIGKPWKTQEKVRQIMDSFYSDKADGLCGNDDAGQMSAWYILSAMGFYPATPGLGDYVLGSPLFDKVMIHLENGRSFIINSVKGGARNKYVQSVRYNGKSHDKSFIRHQQICNGGELTFTMGENPNKLWGSREADRPHTIGYPSPSMPKVETEEHTFGKFTDVVLSCEDPGAEIRYTTDGSDPSRLSALYLSPFRLEESATVKARSFFKGENPGFPVSVDFEKLTPRPATEVKNPQPGLHYDYLEGYCVKVEDMKKYPTIKTGMIPTFTISAITDGRSFGYTYEGYIDIPETGVYTLYVNSNDGGILSVDGKEVINNDGFHKTQEKSKKLALAKGFHPVLLKYFQMGGAKALMVSWQKPSGSKEEVPSLVLYH